ncbi:MAG: PBP1A family penicillin-binding protein, partial [Rhizonema sp. PD38]|nr:PBP1A family penicillin-binding protein [Rhizonema sp. PD38]
TITQQLARILFLTQERTVWRKLKEVRLAQKMERELSKDQILEHYLNLVYLGSGAYGVGDAAHIYFSKSANELTLGEIATIAGLAPAPSRYSPEVNPEAAKQRRNIVLQRMQEEGFITSAEQQAAMAEPIALKHSSPKQLAVEYPYFTTYIQKELPKYVSPDVLAEGGLTVETTLNPTWQKTAEESVAKTLRNQGRWENFKQGSMVTIDPRNGEVEAMVGGKNFGKNQFNRVTQAQRQPGSTFKGFVYATAIASGISPYREYEDAPFVVDGYEPKNFSEKFHGSMSIRDALTKSINIIAVKVLISVGFNPTIKLAHDMGIKSELKPTYSLALGSNEVNLLELTSAYGSFATNGLHVEPHGIKRILNRWGKVIWSAHFKQTRALDAESAAIMTWMLRNVVQEGTGAAAQLDNRPVAGKTGTSDEARDLWFIGYIPQLVTGVWLGNDNNNPTDGSSGSAASTWHQFMETAVKGMAVEKFPSIPKLEGRKGTIKAESVKPRRITYRSISSTEKSDDSSKSDDGDRWQRRRRRSDSSDRDQQQEETSRSRRQHYSEQQNEENYTSRRHSRRERSEESNGESSRSRRRSRREESNSPRASTSHQQSESTTHSSPSSSSQPQQSSWRERLKPSSSETTKSGT